MEVGEGEIEAIDEELSYGGSEDVDMMDVEEGEVVDDQFPGEMGKGNEKELEAQPQHVTVESAIDTEKKKKTRRKRRNRKAKATPGPKGFNLDKFVLGVCNRLKEKKSYLLYTAIGVLGASAISDLVKEVDAIQACGGQKTADGNRNRTGGGILWNILKTRDPNAYKEIMKKGKEFEKQFRGPSTGPPAKNDIAASHNSAPDATNSLNDDLKMKTSVQEQFVQPTTKTRRSVHDRIRVPVSYDDLPGNESPKDKLS